MPHAAYADVCNMLRMLKYADVCRSLNDQMQHERELRQQQERRNHELQSKLQSLTYAHVCLHMLTYAHVCR